MPKSLVARIRLLYLPVDVVFSVLIPLALGNALEPRSWGYALVVLYGLGLVRSTAITILFGRLFGPIGRWLNAPSARLDPRDLREIDRMVRRGPRALSLWVGALWAAQILGGT